MSAVRAYLDALHSHRQQTASALEADLGDQEAWEDFRRKLAHGETVGPPSGQTRSQANRCENESRNLLAAALAALKNLRPDLRAEWRDRLEKLQRRHEGVLSALFETAEDPHGQLWADWCATHQERVEAVRLEWEAVEAAGAAATPPSPPLDDPATKGGALGTAHAPIPPAPPPPADAYAELRQFARDQLKGQERAVIEVLCATNGELRIADLAVKPTVNWSDPTRGFKDVQRRLNPKLKKKGWVLQRRTTPQN